MWSSLAFCGLLLGFVCSIPFEQAVFHVTDDEYTEWREENPRAFVLFYAPGCDGCQEVQAEFAELVDGLKHNSSISLAAMNCAEDAERACESLDIADFPSIELFSTSRGIGVGYHDATTATKMRNYLEQHVQHETPLSFRTFLRFIPHVEGSLHDFQVWLTLHPHALVFFYSSHDCNKCAQLRRPIFEAYDVQPHGTHIAAADCALKAKEICSALGITSFPAFRYFPSSLGDVTSAQSFDGPFTRQDLTNFLHAAIDHDYTPHAIAEAKWEGDNGKIVHLNESTWANFRAENPRVIVLLCTTAQFNQRSLSGFASASRHFGTQNSVHFAAVNCTENPSLCKKYSVPQGFVKVLMFMSAEDENPQELSGAPEEELVVKFIDSCLQTHTQNSPELNDIAQELEKLPLRVLKQILDDKELICDGCTQKGEFLALAISWFANRLHNVFKHTWGEEKRRVAAVGHASMGWGSDEPVHHTTETTLEGDIMLAKGNAMVMFYADWNDECNRWKDEFVAAATELKGKATFFAIECTHNFRACHLYHVQRFPTLIWFGAHHGMHSQQVDFPDPKKVIKGDIVEVVNNLLANPLNHELDPLDEEAQLWGKRNGEVVHLTDDHFNWYHRQGKHVLVMFYVTYLRHSQTFMNHFSEASIQLKDVQDRVRLAAIDCSLHMLTCGNHNVGTFPIFKHFSPEFPLGEEVYINRTDSVKLIVDHVRTKILHSKPAKDEL